jgi:hypothetical protein
VAREMMRLEVLKAECTAMAKEAEGGDDSGKWDYQRIVAVRHECDACSHA